MKPTALKLRPEDGIAIYADGSGKAIEYLESNLKTIRECEKVLKLLRVFIQAHREKLAGLYWRVGYLDPEIELHWYTYRGKAAKPEDVARLWPEAVWTREQEKYGRKDEIQWHANVDGVTLKIQCAERLHPLPVPRLGQAVRISAKAMEAA